MHTDHRARRGLRALVVTAVTFASVLAVASPAPAAPIDTGQMGASWMATQILANRGFLESFGSPDPVDTAYAVIGLHAAKIGGAASDAAIAYLQHHLYAAVQSHGTDAPGAISTYIMAATAAGKDPRHFGGTSTVNNLVARLFATQRTSGKDTGLFGAQDATFDGSYREGLALQAMRAAGVPGTDVHVVRAISWLEKQQCSTGMWQGYRANVKTACATPNPSDFTSPDTNGTAMAFQGLRAFGQTPRRVQALATFHSIEGNDAGFPLTATAGSSDPDSTALVIQALLALGANPSMPAWHKPGGSPYTALAGFQLGCGDAAGDRGAYFYPGSRTPSVFATVQSVPAAERKTLPVAPTTGLGRKQAYPCM